MGGHAHRPGGGPAGAPAPTGEPGRPPAGWRVPHCRQPAAWEGAGENGCTWPAVGLRAACVSREQVAAASQRARLPPLRDGRDGVGAPRPPAARRSWLWFPPVDGAVPAQHSWPRSVPPSSSLARPTPAGPQRDVLHATPQKPVRRQTRPRAPLPPGSPLSCPRSWAMVSFPPRAGSGLPCGTLLGHPRLPG